MQWGLIMAQIFEQLFKQGSTIIWKYNIIFFCTIDIDTMNDIFIDRKKHVVTSSMEAHTKKIELI